MKIKSHFEISVMEIIKMKKLFGFYIAIFICFLSVSMSIMRVAMFLPDGVCDILKDMKADSIMFCAESNILKSVFEKDEIEIYECLGNEFIGEFIFGEEYTDYPEISSSIGGVIINSNFSELYINDLSYNMIQGQTDINTDSYGVWISEYLSDTMNVKYGQNLSVCCADNEIICATVRGIYKTGAEREHFYVTEKLYKSVVASEQQLLQFSIGCKDIKQFQSIKRILDVNEIFHMEDNSVFDSLNMLYVTLYSASVILVLSVSGITMYLLDQYYAERARFYKMVSILGMTIGDMRGIFWMISEVLLVFSLIVSSLISFFLLHRTDIYLNSMLEYKFELSGFPFVPFLVHLVLVQVCLAVIVILIKRKVLSESNQERIY